MGRQSRGLSMVEIEESARRSRRCTWVAARRGSGAVGGDVAVWFGEFDEPHTEGQMRVRALDPELVWLAHEHQPWRPSTVADQPSQPQSV